VTEGGAELRIEWAGKQCVIGSVQTQVADDLVVLAVLGNGTTVPVVAS